MEAISGADIGLLALHELVPTPRQGFFGGNALVFAVG